MGRVKKGRKHKGKATKKKVSRFAQAFAILIAVLFLGSIGGYVGGSQTENSRATYNDYSFKQSNDGFWTVDHDVFGELSFFFFPDELESIPIDAEVNSLLKSPSHVFITYDFSESNDTEQSFQIQEENQVKALAQFNLKNFFEEKKEILTVNALTSMNNYGLQTVSCADATETAPVIYLNLDVNNNYDSGNLTNDGLFADDGQITQEGNCVTISASNLRSLLMAQEKLVYSFTGIVS